jgi:hypothetical protein
MALFRARWIIQKKTNQDVCSTQTFFGEKLYFLAGEVHRSQKPNFDFVTRTNGDKSDWLHMNPNLCKMKARTEHLLAAFVCGAIISLQKSRGTDDAYL